LGDDIPTELASSVFLAVSRRRAKLIGFRSFTCAEGRLAPRGREHCNDFGQSTRSSMLPRFDHRVAAEPEPPRRLTGASGGRRRSTAGENFTPGRQKSLGAPQRVPSSVCNRGKSPRLTFPAGRVARFSGRNPSLPTGLPRALVQCGASLKPCTSAREAGLQAVVKPDAAVRRLEKRSRPSRRGSSLSVSAPSRGRAHPLGSSPDPGPRQLRSQRR